jgi:hypothetical protein
VTADYHIDNTEVSSLGPREQHKQFKRPPLHAAQKLLYILVNKMHDDTHTQPPKKELTDECLHVEVWSPKLDREYKSFSYSPWSRAPLFLGVVSPYRQRQYKRQACEPMFACQQTIKKRAWSPWRCSNGKPYYRGVFFLSTGQYTIADAASRSSSTSSLKVLPLSP